MKRFTWQEIIGIVTPLLAVGLFLFISASGEERFIDSPLVMGAIALVAATVSAALFGLAGAIISGLALTAIALFSDAPLNSAEAQVYVLPALASWFGVGAVMVRRAMMRWKRRKHMNVGQEIERLRAKNEEMKGLLATSGNADSLALSASVWKDQVELLAASAEALMLDVPAEVRAGETFKEFASRVKAIRTATDSLTELVASTGMSVAREIALVDVVGKAIGEVKELADALSIDIETEFQADGVPCVLEEELFQQGIANILRNAVEATGRSGKIKVEVHSDYRNGRAMIEIADRGPGMTADVMAQVFKPFFTTRRDRIGLGLTVAREVIKRAGGSIALSANEPRGMIVRVRLPIKRTAVVKEKAPEEASSPIEQVKAALAAKQSREAEPSADAPLTEEEKAAVTYEGGA